VSPAALASGHLVGFTGALFTTYSGGTAVYGLPEDYRINPVLRIHHMTRDAFAYQTGVYRCAEAILRKGNARQVLDIGCGVPEKLMKYVLPHTREIVGLDLPDCIEAFNAHYPFGEWLPLDIEQCSGITIGKRFDVLIAADVIEHLENPDTLLDFMKRHCRNHSLILLSTPERDTIPLSRKSGPPLNQYHVREWNQAEFTSYIESKGFNVLRSLLFREPLGYKCHTCVCEYPKAED